MHIFDQYTMLEAFTISGEEGSDIVSIPPGTRVCIARVPTKHTPFPYIDVLYEGHEYRVLCKKDVLKVERGNVEVRKLMSLCLAVKRCEEHCEHNIRPEISAVLSALSDFFLRVYELRFLPQQEIRQTLLAFRKDATFRDRIESQYGKRDDAWSRLMYAVSLGHYEYLLRVLEQFLATGMLDEQLCCSLFAHHQFVVCEQNLPHEQTARQVASHIAQEQAALLVAQEKKQLFPYPLLYAAYLVSEYIEFALVQAGFSQRDITYEEQHRIAMEALTTADVQHIFR